MPTKPPSFLLSGFDLHAQPVVTHARILSRSHWWIHICLVQKRQVAHQNRLFCQIGILLFIQVQAVLQSVSKPFAWIRIVSKEHLYKAGCKDDETKLNLFLARVWCLLKRYQVRFLLSITRNIRKFKTWIIQKIFSGVDSNQQSNSNIDEKLAEDKNLYSCYFYTLNHNVLDCLSSLFYVTFEVFSNPFTCYFKQYCSFFDDTDGYFGSRGWAASPKCHTRLKTS